MTSARMLRWMDSRDDATHRCPHCWQGATGPGKCPNCKRFFVDPVAAVYVPRDPLPQPPPGTFRTQAQGAWAAEQNYRRARGLPPLEPKTAAQREVDAGRVPKRPGGELTD